MSVGRKAVDAAVFTVVVYLGVSLIVICDHIASVRATCAAKQRFDRKGGSKHSRNSRASIITSLDDSHLVMSRNGDKIH
jgi:hypothetical protein